MKLRPRLFENLQSDRMLPQTSATMAVADSDNKFCVVFTFMKRLISILVLSLLLVCAALNRAHATQYYISKDAWAVPLYFNVPFTLDKTNFSLQPVTGELKNINEKGAFTIYIKRSVFPVKAPHCTDDWLTATMIETRDTLPAQARQEYRDQKTALYNSLQDLSAKESGSVNVVLAFEGEVYAKRPLDVGIKSGCQILFNQGLDYYDADKGIPAEKHPHYKTITVDKPR